MLARALNRQSCRIRPQIEFLEARDVPAGNVFAEVAEYFGATVLTITGDDLGNNLVVRGSNVYGEVEVLGINTSVNGTSKALRFTGIDRVEVNLDSGNDSIHAQNLSLQDLWVFGGEGDDVLKVHQTTLAPFGSIFVGGDSLNNFEEPATVGDDDISVIGTSGTSSFSLQVIGDTQFANSDDGTDRIRVLDSTLDGTDPGEGASGYYLEVSAGSVGATTGGGNVITIDHFDVISTSPNGCFGFVYVQGSALDDVMTLSNFNVYVRTDGEFSHEMSVGGYGGNDVLNVNNFNVDVLSTADSFWNYVWTGFGASTVNLHNVHQRNGGISTEASNGLVVQGSRVDLRDVGVRSDQGWAYLYLASEYGSGTDDLYTLRNVTVSQNPIWNEAIASAIMTEDGNDVVSIVNSSFNNLVVDLGEGDDALSVMDSSIIAALLLGGNGDDRLAMRNNVGLCDYFEFESL